MAKTRLRTLIKNEKIRTIDECYKEYLVYCKSIGLRPATLSSKERFYKYELLKKVSPLDPITAITQKNIERWVNEYIDRCYKGNTYQPFIVKLKGFMSYCFDREYIERFEIKIPTATQNKKEVYTESELKRLLVKPDLKSCLVGDYRSWVTVNFLLATGCRSTSLLNIRVSDIKLDREVVLLRHMKTYRQVEIPLSVALKGVLVEYIGLLDLKSDDILFPKLDGSQMSYDTLHQNLTNYFKHCKVKMRGVNTFRNTFATMFIKNGGDIYRLKILLNHSNIKTTERYVNLLPVDFKDDLLQFNPLDTLQAQKASRKKIR